MSEKNVYFIGSDYMIPVSRDEILSRFAGIPVVLQTLHKLHPAISCKIFHPGKTGSLFCTAGTKFSHVIALARLGGIKKLIKKYP